jgi:hypothetical protein
MTVANLLTAWFNDGDFNAASEQQYLPARDREAGGD